MENSIQTTDVYKSSFEMLEDTYRALPAREVLEPSVPVEEYSMMGTNLAHRAGKDETDLVGAGLDVGRIRFLRDAAYALRHAQGQWDSVRYNGSDAAQQLSRMLPKGRDMVARLLHVLTYALQGEPRALRNVRRLREGGSKADLVQDLVSLVNLCRRYEALVTAAGFNMNEVDEAIKLSAELSRVNAEANDQASVSNHYKAMRDRAYTVLKKAMDEVRACGQFVYWRDPARLKPYTDSYSPRTRGVEEQETPVEPAEAA